MAAATAAAAAAEDDDGVGDLESPILAGLAGTAIGLTGVDLPPALLSSLLMMESMLKLLDLAAGRGGDAAAEGPSGWR